jgi:hypothetical protein
MSRPEAKKRIPHMLIDTDFFEKPENVEAVDKFGDEAPAAIMRLILKLINEKEARMKKSQVLAMWRASGTDQGKWAEIMEYYIKCGWLVEQDDWICSVRVGKERARVEQKRSTLSANAKQKLSKSSANEQQSASKSSDTDTDTDLNSIKKGKQKILDFVYLDEIEIDGLKCKLGLDGFERACEKLNGWIGESKGTVEFNNRLAKGANAAFTIQNWVSRAISNEGNRPGAPPKTSKTASEIWAEMEKSKD